MRLHNLLLATSALSVLAAPTLAQTSRDPVHGDEDDTIVVTANYIDDLDLLAGTAVLSGNDLVRDIQPQLGDMLARQPGVSATSFSPGASRPVLRGFQGDRIRILTDGIGTLDVSNTSADHAVTIDPLTAERIEVLHGPASLLFGSQAIGGAVNVLDRRIPRVVPERGFHVDAIGSYASAADERSIGSALDVALVENFVVHVDGSYRRSNDLRVGGFILSPGLRAEQLEIAAEETEEGHPEEAAEALALANLSGRIPNSATETWTLGGGFALINDGGSLGVSVSHFDSRYGVPTRPGAEHAHGEEEGGEEETEEGGEEEAPVSIGAKQTRADLRAEILTDGTLLESVRLRIGYSDYRHTEFEGTEIGTRFFAEGVEGRLELVQADRNGWRGVTGIQASTRKFLALGAEAVVPPNVVDQLGLFTLQEIDLDPVGLEFAARFERSNIDAKSVRIGLEPDVTFADINRSFSSYSFAAGASYRLTPDVKIGANLSRVERAPSAEELFSNGPHIATQAYEIGDPTLSKEKSWGLELYARGSTGPAHFSLALYHSWFSDFVYDVETGQEFDSLPVFRYLQAPVRHYGAEAQIAYDIIKTDGYRLTIDALADVTRANISGAGPLPRIPPLRIAGGVEADNGILSGRLEVEHSAAQNRIGGAETATSAFTLVGASLSWKPFGRDGETTLILSGDNLFDVTARRHASFTKDFVPLAGRNIRLSAHVSF